MTAGRDGARVMPDDTLAPKCMVRFRCVSCGEEQILDAYEGAPRHQHGAVKFIMEPLTVVRPGQHPYPMTEHQVRQS